jgi:hypothetical protein
MNKTSYQSFFRGLLVLCALVFSIPGCATDSTNPLSSRVMGQPERVTYDFEFTMLDTPDIELLEYRLETESPRHIFRTRTFENHQLGLIVLQSNNFGAMPYYRPTRLYVKWRIKSTGKEYQDTVDLTRQLPKDMEDSRLTFRMGGALGEQLFVYLVTREVRPKDWPIRGPRLYQDSKVLMLYPDQSQQTPATEK